MRLQWVALMIVGGLSADCRTRANTSARPSDPEESTAIAPGQVPLLPGSDVLPPPRVEAPPATVIPIASSSMVSGVLEAGDSLTPSSGSVCDYYVIRAAAGEPFTIVARGGPSNEAPSARLDMYLYLLFDGAELTHDDDGASSGGALNSRIVWTPAQTGTYVIRVTTFGSGQHFGRYVLQTYPGALPTQL